MDSKFKTIIEQIIYIKENLPNQRFLQLLLNFANTQQDEECINLYFMTDKQLIEQLKKQWTYLKKMKEITTQDLKQIIQKLTNLSYEYNNEKLKGGSITTPTGEIFKDVVVLDFKSFYPSIILSYDLFGKNISLFLEEQIKQKDKGDKNAKLICNTIYGQFKHFDIDKAREVTRIGRRWITGFIDYLSRVGYDVCYSHTDSVMVYNINEFELTNLKSCVSEYLSILRKEVLNKGFINIIIENKFKYIYFKKRDDTFVKNRYTGVYENSSLYFNGFIPSSTDIIFMDIISKKLNKGENFIEKEEIVEYIYNYYKKTKRFINLNELELLQVWDIPVELL